MSVYELTYKEPIDSSVSMGLFSTIESAMDKAGLEDWRAIEWTLNNSNGFVGRPVGGDFYWNVRLRKVE